jgi:hypothetical protein
MPDAAIKARRSAITAGAVEVSGTEEKNTRLLMSVVNGEKSGLQISTILAI